MFETFPAYVTVQDIRCDDKYDDKKYGLPGALLGKPYFFINQAKSLFDHLVSVFDTVGGLDAQTDHPVLCLLGEPRAASRAASIVIIPQPLRCGPKGNAGP